MARQREQKSEKTASAEPEAEQETPRTHRRGEELSVEDPLERLLDYVKKWLSDQKILSGVKIRKTAKVFQQTGEHLEEENQYVISDYVSRSADRMQELSTYLEDRPLEEIPHDLSNLARDKPWLFMGGSLALGLVLTRYFLSSAPARIEETEGGKTRAS